MTFTHYGDIITGAPINAYMDLRNKGKQYINVVIIHDFHSLWRYKHESPNKATSNSEWVYWLKCLYISIMSESHGLLPFYD